MSLFQTDWSLLLLDLWSAISKWSQTSMVWITTRFIWLTFCTDTVRTSCLSKRNSSLPVCLPFFGLLSLPWCLRTVHWLFRGAKVRLVLYFWSFWRLTSCQQQVNKSFTVPYSEEYPYHCKTYLVSQLSFTWQNIFQMKTFLLSFVVYRIMLSHMHFLYCTEVITIGASVFLETMPFGRTINTDGNLNTVFNKCHGSVSYSKHFVWAWHFTRELRYRTLSPLHGFLLKYA